MSAALAQGNFQAPAKRASPLEFYPVQPVCVCVFVCACVKRRREGTILFVLPNPLSSAQSRNTSLQSPLPLGRRTDKRPTNYKAVEEGCAVHPSQR